MSLSAIQNAGYECIKMLYTPGTAQNPIGTFSRAPSNISDNLELKYIYDNINSNPNTDTKYVDLYSYNGNGNVIRVWDWYVLSTKNKQGISLWGGIFGEYILNNSASIMNREGWFYAIDCGDIYIADRPVCLLCTYDEIQQAGYIGLEKKIHLITKTEYETYIKTNPISTVWNNENEEFPYAAHFGEWVDEVNSSNKVLIATRLNALGTGENADYKNRQSCEGWQPKNKRSLLTNDEDAIYIPTAFRPVFIKKEKRSKIYYNIEIGE